MYLALNVKDPAILLEDLLCCCCWVSLGLVAQPALGPA